MQSMTGYGRGRSEIEDVEIEVVIRSVNGRYFEPRFHIPKEYMEFESELKKTLQQDVHRGTLDIYIHRKNRLSKTGIVRVNKNIVKSYIQEWKQLSRQLKSNESPLVRDLFRLPQVLHVEEGILPVQKEKKALQTAFGIALKLLVQEKQREGSALRKELLRLLDSLVHTVAKIEKLREKARQEAEIKWEEKLKVQRPPAANPAGAVGPTGALNVDPASRISQELFIFLEKSDITEEIVRLKEHLMNYRNLLKGAGSEGKKLDFYTQELLREINTIGSKSQVSVITQAVVEAKTLIEKLREQVQNIE